MNRPYVQVTSQNLLQERRAELMAVLPELKAHPGLVGISHGGGMSRGYADQFSDIDVTLYLAHDAYRDWVQERKRPLSAATQFHDTMYDVDGTNYDIKIVDISAERERTWSQVELWDASYAEILFDPKGEVRDLFDSKLGQLPNVEETKRLLFDSWWHYHLGADAWMHRGDPQQVQLLLNSAVHLLVSALYLVNNEYIPHVKWLVHMTRSLPWLPERWEERLGQAMGTAGGTMADLRRRQAAIAGLKEEMDKFLSESHVRKPFPGRREQLP